jgi:formyltetrahydrofolate-dependent phosphoribosylglycinamide formyltransferase
MLKKLQQRWKVNSWNLLLIITTFAMGGSACAYLSRVFLEYAGINKNGLGALLYITLITLLWPICVLIISIPLGQFSFFKSYLHRVWMKLTGKSKKKVSSAFKIAIFASGKGTNANNIISYFENITNIEIGLVITNNPSSGVINIAKAQSIPCHVLVDNEWQNGKELCKLLEKEQIQLIVLAGYLKKIPNDLIKKFNGKIINIHPALLPKYGGKGMYGSNVHRAVIAANEKQSGITIHFVDEVYDNGEIIFQQSCNILPSDSAESLAQKIHQLEHVFFPKVIHEVIEKQMHR